MSNRGAEIFVRDNGPGMSEDLLAKIMQPLFTTKKFGVGLGLPAVQKVFEQHGGGMEITSSEGTGTCATGWWPIEVSRGQQAA